MSYDRVAYSDKRPFSSEEYADDPSHPEKRHVNGNGIYNDYTVEVEPRTVKPLKFLCFTCKNTKRAKFVMICSGLVLLVCIVLVVVSAVAHAKHSKNSPPAKQYGRYKNVSINISILMVPYHHHKQTWQMYVKTRLSFGQTT